MYDGQGVMTLGAVPPAVDETKTAKERVQDLLWEIALGVGEGTAVEDWNWGDVLHALNNHEQMDTVSQAFSIIDNNPAVSSE